MDLHALVATHADQNLETVARLSASSAGLAGTGVILATCNRFEVYALAADPEAHRREIISEIARSSELSETFVAQSLRSLNAREAGEHLCAVAAGLDSAVVGEREIAGQVRRALSEAQSAYSAAGSAVPGTLVRLFQTASKTAKRVGSQTALGSQGRSIVSVALDLAAESFPSDDSAKSSTSPAGSTEGPAESAWQQKHAVIFGTGAYAGITMALLRERGVQSIAVYSASGRAGEFVASRGGTPVDSLEEALGHADLIIGCSGSERRIAASTLASIRQSSGRREEPLTVIDLALSRDFDPAIAELPGVELLSLESVRLAAPAEQESALAEARSIVAESAEEFRTGDTNRQISPAIIALRNHTLTALESEMERVRAQHGCTAAAEEVEFALRRMVRQLLHLPTMRARELAAEGRQDEYIAALETLYGITPAHAAAEENPSTPHPARSSSKTTTDSPEPELPREHCPVDPAATHPEIPRTA